MPRNSIMMFRGYMEAAEALAEESKDAAYDYLHALLKYALDEEEPELKGSVKSVFILTKFLLWSQRRPEILTQRLQKDGQASSRYGEKI